MAPEEGKHTQVMADADKLNIDSIIARLLEGKLAGIFCLHGGIFHSIAPPVTGI